MKKYLQKMLREEKEKLNKASTKEEFDNICRNILELEIMINRQMFQYKYIRMASNVQINEYFYNFIKNVIDLYANIPLLESESTVPYPLLTTIKDVADKELFDFWNNIYQQELPHISKKIINLSNTFILNKHYNIFRFNNGKCLIYNDFFYQKKHIILQKYHNVRDYIVPCSKAVELLYPTSEQENDITYQILTSYMNYKSIYGLKKSKYFKEAKKLELINTDNLAFEARYLKKQIENLKYEELNDLMKGRLLSFINMVIGYESAKNNTMSLKDILDRTQKYSSDEYVNAFGTSQESIIDSTKVLVKTANLKRAKK